MTGTEDWRQDVILQWRRYVRPYAKLYTVTQNCASKLVILSHAAVSNELQCTSASIPAVQQYQLQQSNINILTFTFAYQGKYFRKNTLKPFYRSQMNTIILALCPQSYLLIQNDQCWWCVSFRLNLITYWVFLRRVVLHLPNTCSKIIHLYQYNLYNT
jgi:hypothetical protein